MKALMASGILILLGVGLAGCDGTSPPQQPQPGPTSELPSPVQVIGPDSKEDCTTTLGKSAEGMEDPDRVTIRCAGKTIAVAGTFRDRYTNIYDPKLAQGIEKILVVGGEVRAWIGYGESTCLILHTPGTPPAQCKPTQQQPSETRESTPPPTNPGEQNS